MPSDSDLPAILRLLDDENPTVREAVMQKLASYGRDLATALDAAAPGVPLSLREEALSLQQENRREEFLREWENWSTGWSGTYKLETGLSRIASYLSDEGAEAEISRRLDTLTREFKGCGLNVGFAELAEFLFVQERLRGEQADYYHPDNSNFLHVLQRGRGNPISLACVYILVGRRLGLNVWGCNYPAHFLARAISEKDGELYLIDCFNGGRIISAEDLIEHHPLASKEVESVVREAPSPEVILSRVLRNLENAFSQMATPEEQRFVRQLLDRLQESS